jgi:predicted ABC-type ATPase
VVSFAEKAGKTTFARDYLPAIAGLIHFVNVGLIAGGISPLRPELAAFIAGRLVLRELDRLVAAREDFAFESTLSGLRLVGRLFTFNHQNAYVIQNSGSPHFPRQAEQRRDVSTRSVPGWNTQIRDPHLADRE